MGRLLVSLCFFAVCLTAAQAQTDPKFDFATPVKRLAFVVGNSEYVNAEPLPGSITDAKAIAEKLKAADFDVTLALNVKTRSEFVQKFQAFRDKIEEGSFVVFYYSGHGFTYGGESYLTPLQFPKKVPSTKVFTTFMSASALQDQINAMDPGVLIMFLDACRDVSGFIEPSPGAAADVKKGLVPLASVQNNLIGYATAPGHTSVGNYEGKLSEYTAALVSHIPTVDEEFDKTHKAVVSDVRDATSAAQTPWLATSNTLEIYFSASGAMQEQLHTAWLAAQQQDSAAAVRRYLDMFGLGPYAAAARKWLAEKSQQASIFTQHFPVQIDMLWVTPPDKEAKEVYAKKIKGPFGLSRVTEGDFATLTSLPPGAGTQTSFQPNPKQVGELLASQDCTIVLAPITARVKPDGSSSPAASLDFGSKICGTSVEQTPKGDVWLKGFAGTGGALYVPIPPNAGTQDVPIGRPLKEFDLDPPTRGSAAAANAATIENNLNNTSEQITWASISVPSKNSKGENFSPREAARLSSRAAYGAYLLSKTVPRGRITIVDAGDFAGDNPRVRIFSK
jgi:uncharacterized caspase-like protein